MARPSTLLRWANAVTGGKPGRIEPNDGKKDQGFDDGEAPAAGEHNWIFGLAGDWITYLDEQATRLLNAALLSALNTFARTLIVDNNDNEEALLSTTKLPQDSVVGGVAYPTNTFKLLINTPIDSGTCRLRFYVGKATDGSSPSLAITFNAFWSTNTANHWYADDSFYPATALFIYIDRLEFRRQEAPAPTSWSSWPDHGDVLAGASINAGANVTAQGNVVVGAGDFVYQSPRSRTSILRLADAVGDAARTTDGGIASGGGKVCWPVRIPRGATLGNIEILHDQTTVGSADLFALVTRHGTNWATPALPTYSTPATATATAGSGLRRTVLSTSGFTYPNDDDEAELVWQVTAGASANKVIQIRMVFWDDLGPSNV